MILVTGGAGFIGSHVVRRLLDAGHSVVVLDDLSGGCRENLDSRAKFVEGSIEDAACVDALAEQWQITDVVHAAAYAAEVRSQFARSFTYRNNLVGSANVINAAVRHRCQSFVFLSSIAVYGDAKSPMDETTIPRPVDPYGIAKYAVELDLAAAGRVFGLPYTIFRPHNVYGEGQNLWDADRNVVAIFMRRALRGDALPVFGDGTQVRAFTHVDDVARVIASAVYRQDVAGETFNIGADIPCSVNALAHKVRRAMNSNAGIIHRPPRLEVHTAYADHRKVARWFGTTSEIGLDEGLKRMAAWVRTQRDVERHPRRPTPELSDTMDCAEDNAQAVGGVR